MTESCEHEGCQVEPLDGSRYCQEHLQTRIAQYEDELERMRRWIPMEKPEDDRRCCSRCRHWWKSSIDDFSTSKHALCRTLNVYTTSGSFCRKPENPFDTYFEPSLDAHKRHLIDLLEEEGLLNDRVKAAVEEIRE